MKTSDGAESVNKAIFTITTLCSATITLNILFSMAYAVAGDAPNRPSNTAEEPQEELSFEQELAIELLRGCDYGDRFEDLSDGTVVDCNTELVWLKDISCALLSKGQLLRSYLPGPITMRWSMWIDR